MFIQVSQTTKKGHTTIRFAATPKSARTRALLAQFKKGVRAIEKKWKAHAAVVGSIELDGPIGSHTLEAVRLEIRRLARACGLDVVDVRVETRGKASG